MRIVGVIPERMNSSRFYGKPIAKILGKPMVQHVWEHAKDCKLLDELWVATGDKCIIDCVKSFKGNIIQTRDDHYRASNQVAEAIRNLESDGRERYDIVCMIQGDEPMVTPSMIESSIQPLVKDKELMVTNLMERLNDSGDKNEVKVVVDKKGFALYFSRCDIPFGFKELFKQVCVISFKHDALLVFPKLKETSLERLESIDMLRFLENDIKVKMVPVDRETFSVDTVEDLRYVEYCMKE